MKSIRRFLLLISLVPRSLMAAEGAAPGAHGDTFMDLFLMSGPVGWILLVASILIMAFAIEAVIKIRMGRLAPPAVYAQLKDAFVSGNYPQAFQICVANPVTWAGLSSQESSVWAGDANRPRRPWAR